MKTLNEGAVFTTTQVARYCHVDPKTVINWTENGLLKSHKTPGGFRRILREDLLGFLKRNNFPLGDLEEPRGKILIVDDEPLAVQIIKSVIEDECPNYRVETATGGEEGVFKIAIFKPDLVILDIRMPRIDGFKVYDIVKSTPETMDVEILFITGFDTKEVNEGLKQRNISNFLRKPFQHEDLVKKVLKIFSDKPWYSQA